MITKIKTPTAQLFNICSGAALAFFSLKFIPFFLKDLKLLKIARDILPSLGQSTGNL